MSDNFNSNKNTISYHVGYITRRIYEIKNLNDISELPECCSCEFSKARATIDKNLYFPFAKCTGCENGKKCIERIRKYNKEHDFKSNEVKIEEKKKSDNVNHPSHYTDGKYEVIDFIEQWGLGYHLGNAVKYICRAGKKDPTKTIEDLEKAKWYVNRANDVLERDDCELDNLYLSKYFEDIESGTQNNIGIREFALDKQLGFNLYKALVHIIRRSNFKEASEYIENEITLLKKQEKEND